MESPKPGKTQDMYSPHTINEDKELYYETNRRKKNKKRKKTYQTTK